MRYYKFKPIGTLLKESPNMQDIFQKLQKIEEIKQLIPQILPKYIMDNCMVANLKSNILTLVTNSPTWKYKLNYLKIELLEKLRKSNPILAGLNSINIKIDYLQEDLHKYYYDDYTNKFHNKHLLQPPTKCTSYNQLLQDNNNKHQFNLTYKTSKLVENMISEEIKYQPLLEAFKKLLIKITKI